MKNRAVVMGVLTLLFSWKSLWAIGTTEPPIRKGAAIMVHAYDAVTNSVEIRLVNEPAVGPNYADVGDVVQAVGMSGPKAEEFRKQPTSVKGVVFNLQTDLKLLNFYELKARMPKEMQKRLEEEARQAEVQSAHPKDPPAKTDKSKKSKSQ